MSEHPPYYSGDYQFRNDCDADRLTKLPLERRDMGEWSSFERAYLPPPNIPKDALILDVGAEAGDTAVFFFEHGYTNLRLVEPYPPHHSYLIRNTDILRNLGCKIELHLETFKPKHLEGVAFIKIDAEGAEWEPWFNLNGGGIPWGGELHMKGAPIRPESTPENPANDYYCSIGLFRGDGQNHFRQVSADNMERHNWSFYDGP